MNQALAELHLLLSRAFLPPIAPDFARSFRRDLPDDLEALALELPFPCMDAVEGLRASLADLESDLQLLQTYSALFLQPPVRVHLNASLYLDGFLFGASAKLIEQAYDRHGLAPSEQLRDLADHLARMLEFVAILHARAAESDEDKRSALTSEAREFSMLFLRPWLPGFAVEVRNACEELGLLRPYQHLAELAAIAAWEGDAWRRSEETAPDTVRRAQRQAHCVACGHAYAEDAVVAAVRRIMRKRGLETSHLDRCPNCRGLTDDGRIETLPAGKLGIADAR
ncbi:MAG: molecular chaperone TorD family protein [Rhodocyclaceae bacterium]|nr:molecular chaperone TorD family protein [Rhodocyclaceae bacterium]